MTATKVTTDRHKTPLNVWLGCVVGGGFTTSVLILTNNVPLATTVLAVVGGVGVGHTVCRALEKPTPSQISLEVVSNVPHMPNVPRTTDSVPRTTRPLQLPESEELAELPAAKELNGLFTPMEF